MLPFNAITKNKSEGTVFFSSFRKNFGQNGYRRLGYNRIENHAKPSDIGGKTSSAAVFRTPNASLSTVPVLISIFDTVIGS